MTARMVPWVLGLLLLDGCSRGGGRNLDENLVRAAERGDVQAVLWSLRNRANVDARDAYGRTPLIVASYMGHVRIVEELLAAKADLNARARHGGTALDFATRAGHAAVIAMLATAGAEQDWLRAPTPTGEPSHAKEEKSL